MLVIGLPQSLKKFWHVLEQSYIKKVVREMEQHSLTNFKILQDKTENFNTILSTGIVLLQ